MADKKKESTPPPPVKTKPRTLTESKIPKVNSTSNSGKK